jgi:hypothetical protein
MTSTQDHYNASNRHLSIIMNLNDNYEGGDLIFTDQKEKEIKRLKLDKGTIVFFPSNFMYPHSIQPITKGTRYSIVCMARIDYKLIKNFFSKEELNVLEKYCYNKLDSNKDYEIDNQSFSPAWYNDPLMTSFLNTKLPLVEKESNLKLFQTYAYWRYYVFGGTLKKHKIDLLVKYLLQLVLKI